MVEKELAPKGRNVRLWLIACVALCLTVSIPCGVHAGLFQKQEKNEKQEEKESGEKKRRKEKKKRKKKAEQEKPPADLFQAAEQNAEKLTRRMAREQTEASEKTQKQIVEEENQNRARAIQKYRALLAGKKRLDPATVEASMLNLAHLTFEQCLADYRNEMRTYDDAYRKYKLGYRKDEPDALPQYDFRAAREAYEAFLEAFPDSKYRPEVIYNLAYSYEEEGDLDKAVSLYDELALTAPDAAFAPEIFLRLGEHSFETNRFVKAIEYYEKVLAMGDTPQYEKALFKIGWCRYAMDQYDEAQDAFARVLALHSERPEERRGDLYLESLEILAKILSETGGAAALETFLEVRKGPAYGLDLSVQLGAYFQETARYGEAIDTYREILDTYPRSSQAPFVEQSLIQSLKTEKRYAEAEALQGSMIERYGSGTAWDQANQDPALRKQVDGILREALNQELLAHHKLARETKDPKEYEKTIALYETMLAYFPEGEKAYETRFLFAECLFESGRLEEAAHQYELVAKVDTYAKYRDKAASKRIQCLEALRTEERIDVDTLLAAYEDYIRMDPESEKAVPIRFKQGEILFNAGRYDQAALIFREIVETRPKHKEVLRAWILELESLFEGGQYEALEQWAYALEKQRFELTQQQENRREHLLRFAQFQQARADQDAGNYLEAASGFEALVAQAPKIEIAPDALFNAAVCYEKADEPAKAAACHEQIVLHYPSSKHYADSLLAPLAYYEKTEQWDRLLFHLEKLYQNDPKSSLAKETFYKMGKRFYRNENYPKAREIFAVYAGHYPEDASRKLEFAYLEAQMSETEGHTQDAMQRYRQFLEAYGQEKATDPSLTVAPLHLATARFRTMDPVYEQYMAVQLKEPLKKNLAKKQSLLDRVVSGYMETVKSGAGAFALAAAFRVGEAYEEFWHSLLNSEVPKGFNEEERRVYRELLEEQGAPYRDKALTAYEVTLEKARAEGVFNEWVLRTYHRLASLDPEGYPPMLQDALVWRETWQAKRSLVRTIDTSKPRTFSSKQAASLQSALDDILDDLRKEMQEGKLKRSQILRAVELLRELLDQEPTLYEVSFNLGILYQTIGENDKAGMAYEESLKQNPRSPVAHLNLGLVELERGDLEKAKQNFKELSVLSPKYAGAYYLLGVCQSKSGEYGKAIDSLTKAIDLLPQFLDPYVELGKVQDKLGRKEEAKKSFLAVLDHPKASARVLRMLAYRLMEAGWIEQSIVAYTQILQGEEPTYGDWNNRGVAYRRQGDREKARKDIIQASDLNSSRPEAFSNLGRLYVEMESYDHAASSFLKALEIEPAFLPALLNAAMVHGLYLNDMETATAYLRKYLDVGGTMQREMFQGWLAGSEEVGEEPELES
jgi:tetratricopeptide (TPR) repeat protein